MKEKLSIKNQEPESVIRPSHEPSGNEPTPNSLSVEACFHRLSASPRRRYRQSGSTDCPAPAAEKLREGKRSCRTVREPNTNHQGHSEKQNGLAASAETSSQPMTLVERLETMTKGIRIAELAVLLGTGRTTLYDWVEAGTIPAYRHRGVIFFDPVVVAPWLRRQATVVRAEAA